jgi:hypothetical protein
VSLEFIVSDIEFSEIVKGRRKIGNFAGEFVVL